MGCILICFLGEHLFPKEIKEEHAKEFLNLKHEVMSVQEYNLKVTRLSLYAPEMVIGMRSRIRLFVSKMSHLSSKQGKAAMLIGDIDIAKS